MNLFRKFFGLFRRKGSGWRGFDAVTEMKDAPPNIFDRQNQ